MAVEEVVAVVSQSHAPCPDRRGKEEEGAAWETQYPDQALREAATTGASQWLVRFLYT